MPFQRATDSNDRIQAYSLTGRFVQNFVKKQLNAVIVLRKVMGAGLWKKGGIEIWSLRMSLILGSWCSRKRRETIMMFIALSHNKLSRKRVGGVSTNAVMEMTLSYTYVLVIGELSIFWQHSGLDMIKNHVACCTASFKIQPYTDAHFE